MTTETTTPAGAAATAAGVPDVSGDWPEIDEKLRADGLRHYTVCGGNREGAHYRKVLARYPAHAARLAAAHWIAEEAGYDWHPAGEDDDDEKLDFEQAAEDVDLRHLVQYVVEGHAVHSVEAPDGEDPVVKAALAALAAGHDGVAHAAGLGADFGHFEAPPRAGGE